MQTVAPGCPSPRQRRRHLYLLLEEKETEKEKEGEEKEKEYMRVLHNAGEGGHRVRSQINTKLLPAAEMVKRQLTISISLAHIQPIRSILCHMDRRNQPLGSMKSYWHQKRPSRKHHQALAFICRQGMNPNKPALPPPKNTCHTGVGWPPQYTFVQFS